MSFLNSLFWQRYTTCMNNCSFPHGTCNFLGCQCEPGFGGADCSYDDVVAAEGIRWTVVVLAFAVCVVTFLRIVAIARIKNSKEGKIIRSGKCRDPQILTLAFTFCDCALMGCSWMLGVDSGSLRSVAVWQLSQVCFGLAASSAVHFLVAVFSRFHLPSRRNARMFLGLTLLFAGVFTLGIALLIASRTLSRALYNDIGNYMAISAGALWIVVLFVFGFVYGTFVLGPPKDPAVLRVQTQVERSARANLLLLLRGTQLGALALLAAVVFIATQPTSGPLDLAFYAVMSLVQVIMSIGLLSFMGRRRTSNGERISIQVSPLSPSHPNGALLNIQLETT